MLKSLSSALLPLAMSQESSRIQIQSSGDGGNIGLNIPYFRFEIAPRASDVGLHTDILTDNFITHECLTNTRSAKAQEK